MTDQKRIIIERDGESPNLFGITKVTIDSDGDVKLEGGWFDDMYIETDIDSLRKIIEIYDNLRTDRQAERD